jgi:hypothetical protein
MLHGFGKIEQESLIFALFFLHQNEIIQLENTGMPAVKKKECHSPHSPLII